MAAALPAAVRGVVPVQPDRDRATIWLVEELSKQAYAAERPGPVERLVSWLLDLAGRVDTPDGPVSGIGAAVVVGIVLAVVAYAVRRGGGLRRQGRRLPGAVLDAHGTTAAEHRTAADRHAAAGQWGPAVVERFRAVTRELEDRTVLAAQPGRTAGEVAREAGALLPGLVADLDAGALWFDQVRYGDDPGSPAADAQLRRLDAAVRRGAGARPEAGTERLVAPS